ncbi:MAG TPA: MraY family glycosyltransferase [Rhizomicrobium sp.]|nr:MraY family glycosyltransferase [Rhizomicrobium sp.]
MHIDFNGIEIASALAALALSLVLLFAAESLARFLSVLDHPDNGRKRHARATPLIGGLAIMVPVLAWSAFALFVPEINAPLAWSVLLCGGGAALSGFIDDRASTSPPIRLVTLLALTVLALIIDPELVPAAFNWGHLAPTAVSPWLAIVLVAIGMTGFVNAVNMADGQDGCVAGMFTIWSACMVMTAGNTTADLALVLLATSLAVLAFNLRGLVFLGGAGAYGATFVFGLLILRLHNYWGVTAETIIVWFFVPIVDCLRLLVSRPLTGRSPFEGDRNHFHHRLGERYGDAKGLAIYLSLVASTSFVAALKPGLAPACLVALALAYAGLMWWTGPAMLHARRPV